MGRLYVNTTLGLCAILDRIPSREGGRWYMGAYGCRSGLSRHAAECDERWGTQVFQAAE